MITHLGLSLVLLPCATGVRVSCPATSAQSHGINDVFLPSEFMRHALRRWSAVPLCQGTTVEESQAL